MFSTFSWSLIAVDMKVWLVVVAMLAFNIKHNNCELNIDKNTKLSLQCHLLLVFGCGVESNTYTKLNEKFWFCSYWQWWWWWLWEKSKPQ